MFELLFRIPDNIGWIIVGTLGMLAAIMTAKVGKIIYIAIHDRLTDDEKTE